MSIKARQVEFSKSLDRRKQVIVGAKRSQWWSKFNYNWHDCQRCPLAAYRERVVHFRGIIPAKVCFIGEAPGVSEDERGRPFVGPAGMLADQLIEQAGLQDGDYCMINTVGCIPYRPGDEIIPPEKSAIKTCQPRFEALLQEIRPALVVFMGRVAASIISRVIDSDLWEYHPAHVELVHPSSFLQSKSPSQSVINQKRFVLNLREAVSKLQLF